MTQPELDFTDPPTGTLRERAERWMDRNGEAMDLFRRFAREAADRGRRFGAKQLAERVRWECSVGTHGDAFKVNNSYVAWIARRLIAEMPELSTLIETREVMS